MCFLTGDVDSGDDNESDERQPSINMSPSSRIPTTNQSQRRLRPPIVNARKNFHHHSSGRQQSSSHMQSQQPQSQSATPSPLCHQAGTSLGPSIRLVPIPSQNVSLHKPVNHLDLLSGLSETTSLHQRQIPNIPNAINRQVRTRAYGNGAKSTGNGVVGSGMPRHETKL